MTLRHGACGDVRVRPRLACPGYRVHLRRESLGGSSPGREAASARTARSRSGLRLRWPARSRVRCRSTGWARWSPIRVICRYGIDSCVASRSSKSASRSTSLSVRSSPRATLPNTRRLLTHALPRRPGPPGGGEPGGPRAPTAAQAARLPPQAQRQLEAGRIDEPCERQEGIVGCAESYALITLSVTLARLARSTWDTPAAYPSDAARSLRWPVLDPWGSP